MLSLGFSISAARLGLPDVGLISYGEMLDQGRQITQAVSIPVIGDGDNGYGNAMNVKRTVKDFIRAGFAGIILEDQVDIFKKILIFISSSFVLNNFFIFLGNCSICSSFSLIAQLLSLSLTHTHSHTITLSSLWLLSFYSRLMWRVLWIGNHISQ